MITLFLCQSEQGVAVYDAHLIQIKLIYNVSSVLHKSLGDPFLNICQFKNLPSDDILWSTKAHLKYLQCCVHGKIEDAK